MTKTKTILIAASCAAVTFWLIYFGAKTGYPPSPFQMGLHLLLLPAVMLGEAYQSLDLFLIVGFLEFFLPYWVGLRLWSKRKRVS